MMKPRPEEALFKDCFIEATGIGAGVALVAGLSKGVVSKAVVKATRAAALPKHTPDFLFQIPLSVPS